MIEDVAPSRRRWNLAASPPRTRSALRSGRGSQTGYSDAGRHAALCPLPRRRGPRRRGAGHRRDAAADRGGRRRDRRADVLAAPGQRPGARVPLPRGDHRRAWTTWPRMRVCLPDGLAEVWLARPAPPLPERRIITSGCTGGVSFGAYLEKLDRLRLPPDDVRVMPERVYVALRQLYDHSDALQPVGRRPHLDHARPGLASRPCRRHPGRRRGHRPPQHARQAARRGAAARASTRAAR